MSWVSRLSCLGLPAFCVVLKPRGSQVSPIFEPWVPPGGFFQKEFDISELPAGNCPRRMIGAPRAEFVLMERPVHISRVSRFLRFSALVLHAGPRRPGPFPFSLPVGPFELFSASLSERNPDRQPRAEHEQSQQPDVRNEGANHLGLPGHAREA